MASAFATISRLKKIAAFAAHCTHPRPG